MQERIFDLHKNDSTGKAIRFTCVPVDEQNFEVYRDGCECGRFSAAAEWLGTEKPDDEDRYMVLAHRVATHFDIENIELAIIRE